MLMDFYLFQWRMLEFTIVGGSQTRQCASRTIKKVKRWISCVNFYGKTDVGKGFRSCEWFFSRGRTLGD